MWSPACLTSSCEPHLRETRYTGITSVSFLRFAFQSKVCEYTVQHWLASHVSYICKPQVVLLSFSSISEIVCAVRSEVSSFPLVPTQHASSYLCCLLLQTLWNLQDFQNVQTMRSKRLFPPALVGLEPILQKAISEKQICLLKLLPAGK